MSVSKNLIYLLASGWNEPEVTAIEDWEVVRAKFIKHSDAWEIAICELNEDTKTYEKICEVWKKWARFGDIDCIMIQRFCGKRKYKEHQLCETLKEIPTDIRPYLYKLK